MNTRGFNDASLVGFRGVAVTLPVSQPLHHLSLFFFSLCLRGRGGGWDLETSSSIYEACLFFPVTYIRRSILARCEVGVKYPDRPLCTKAPQYNPYLNLITI
jgi:hypothetical protein